MKQQGKGGLLHLEILAFLSNSTSMSDFLKLTSLYITDRHPWQTYILAPELNTCTRIK